MEYIKELSVMLEVKACDLRAALYTQSRSAADRGIHIGGAQTAVVPMAALYYGGGMRYCLDDPTTEDQDIFILSKGHAVAALAAVFADIGYIPDDALLGSRAWGAVVKGHPGPVIPGVPVATGPLGHGIGIACGFAVRQKERGGFNTYVLAGDGELQEGSCWESMLFAAHHKLDNLCVIVDKNNGQSDDTKNLLVGLDDLGARFEAFGFRVFHADASNIPQLLASLEEFGAYPRNGKPTAIICDCYKGYGGFSSNAGKHKSTTDDEDCDNELMFLGRRREKMIAALNHMDLSAVTLYAEKIGYRAEYSDGMLTGLVRIPKTVNIKRAAKRDKSLCYDSAKLPQFEIGQTAAPTEIGIALARTFAQDSNFYTIDSDLSNISGLFEGTALTDRTRAFNAGIAECHMMNMAEGLAAVGANVWVCTFGPFFNIQAFRRICVSFQERAEVIEAPGGWLSEGHNLDITFLSIAANLDTGVNGATHISNDDITTIGQLAHVKIIDTSCPQQLLAAAKWIAQGGRGLVYLRAMRNPSPVLYGKDFTFEYGRGYFLRGDENSGTVIITSGHGVLEALAAADILSKDGIDAAVADMPSYDGVLLRKLAESGKTILFAEQNNGWLYDCFCRDVITRRFVCESDKIHRISARDENGNLRFIQSGTYDQLIGALGLCPRGIADTVKKILGR
ncbi:MAG: transketolase [Oscillospiraceae bacterium]|nr:transketolase [Oscillospiraceae bacterium]